METQAQSDEGLMVRDIGIAYKRGDTSLVSRRGGSRSSGVERTIKDENSVY